MQRAMPRSAHAYGETDSRKAPTLKASPSPVKSMSARGRRPLSAQPPEDVHLHGAPLYQHTRSHHGQKGPNAADSIREAHCDDGTGCCRWMWVAAVVVAAAVALLEAKKSPLRGRGEKRKNRRWLDARVQSTALDKRSLSVLLDVQVVAAAPGGGESGGKVVT